MPNPRIMIAAAGSGSGKTLLTCALLQALSDMGKKTAAFKCGPDYIDPMFHKKVLGIASRNLDPYFTGRDLTVNLFAKGAAGADISVMEGVMGLYDGLGGISEEASSYDLACITKTPVVLVVDARGMGRSLLALIAGFLQYDREKRIKGVILNRTTKSFCDMIRPVIEASLPVRVLGFFPNRPELALESRHLGLKLPDEIDGLRERVGKAAAFLREAVDMTELTALAEAAEPLEVSGAPGEAVQSEELELCRTSAQPEMLRMCRTSAQSHAVGLASDIQTPGRQHPISVGIARDEAFCFYYEDNLELLEKAGARLVPFSPIHDRQLPEGIQGMILGGGYPELYAGLLSANTSMRESVAAALRSGMPSLAECGGFMYLHKAIEDVEGRSYPMAGLLPGTCRYRGKLVRFGYVELQEKNGWFLEEGQVMRGHEFHYFDSEDNGSSCVAVKPVSGRSWECVHTAENRWWGFPHLYYYSNPQFVESFMERVAGFGQA